MGIGKGGSAPTAPDPYAMAAAQYQYNNLNQYGPNGTVEYGFVGPNGNFNAGTPGQGQQGAVRTTESPFQKQLREMQESGAINLAQGVLGSSIPGRPTIGGPSFAGSSGTNVPRGGGPYTGVAGSENGGSGGFPAPGSAGAPPTGGGQHIGTVGEIESEIYNRHLPMVSRTFADDRMNQENRLQNRGIPIGAESFADGMRPVSEAQSLAISDLALGAFDRAGTEQSRQVDQARSLRSDALNETLGVLGGGFSPSPLVQSGGNANVPIGEYINSNYQAQLQQYNQQQQQRGSLFGGLISAGAGLLSDVTRKVVHAVETPVLDAAMDVPVGRWSYDEAIPDQSRHIGPMAQDFAKAFGVGDGRSIQVTDYLGVMFGMMREMAAKIENLEARV